MKEYGIYISVDKLRYHKKIEGTDNINFRIRNFKFRDVVYLKKKFRHLKN